MLAESLVVSWVWLFPWTKRSQSRGRVCQGHDGTRTPWCFCPSWARRMEVTGGRAHQDTDDPPFSFLSIGDPQRIYTQAISFNTQAISFNTQDIVS